MEEVTFDENIQINIKKEKEDVFEDQHGGSKSSQHKDQQVNGIADIKIETMDDVEMKNEVDDDEILNTADKRIKREHVEYNDEVSKENESDNELNEEDESNDGEDEGENITDSEKPEEDDSIESEDEIATVDNDDEAIEEVLEVDEESSKDNEEEEEEQMDAPKVYYASDIISESCEEDRLVEGTQDCEICGKSFKSIEYFYIHKRLHLEGRLNKFPNVSKSKSKTSGASTSTQSVDYGSDSHSSDSDDSSDAAGILTHTVGPSSSNQFRSRLREGRSDLLVEGPRVCKFCGKTFYSMDYYRIHQRVHVSEKLKHVPLQQTKQNKGPGGKSSTVSSQDHQVISVYPQMGVLDVKESPMNTQKIPGTKKCCVCDVCHLTFPNYRSLILHRKVHRKGLCTVYPLYVCSVCNRGFVSKQSFLTHCDFHDAKPWTCNVCGMSFSKKLYLGMHKTSKHKQKRYDYKCDDCGKLFEKSKDLQKHQKIHNPDKPQESIKISCLCQVCGKMLPLQSTKDLRIHMGIHFGEILQCHICPEIFRETDEFKEHMDRHLGL